MEDKTKHNCGYPDSHGQTLRHQAVGGFELLESRHRPDLMLDWHYHARSCITYVFDGGYRETYRGRELDCRSGSILVKPRGERHADHYSNRGARSVVLGLPDDREADVGSYIYDGKPLLLYRPDIASLGRRLRDELIAPDSISPMIVDGVVLQILGESLRKNTSTDGSGCPSWIDRVREKIHDDFREPIGLGELAAVAGVHPDHLSRSFKLHVGVLIGDYIRACRLEWARSKLMETAEPIANIALAAGFSDQSHLTRHFKRQFGTTPAAFRRSRS